MGNCHTVGPNEALIVSGRLVRGVLGDVNSGVFGCMNSSTNNFTLAVQLCESQEKSVEQLQPYFFFSKKYSPRTGPVFFLVLYGVRI